MPTSKDCFSCLHEHKPATASPCSSCSRGRGFSNWEPKETMTVPMQQPQPGARRVSHAVLVDGKPEPHLKAAPDSNPKTRFGMAKPPISLVPGSALVLMATAFGDGAKKYGPANWRVDPVSTSTYLNAALRHILSWQDGEETAEDSGVHHLAHAAACLAILMDAQVAGSLLDDRPKACPTAGLIKGLTKPLS